MTIRMNWGTGIAIAYVAFAAATMGFVVFAMGTPADLVSQDYYARSLRQEQRIQATRSAAALHDRAGCQLNAGGGTLVVRVPAEDAATARGTVTLYRPSNGAADRAVPLAPGADGVQQVPLGGLAAGRWVAQMEWTARGQLYYLEQPITVR